MAKVKFHPLIYYKADAILYYLQVRDGHPITRTEKDVQAVIKFLQTEDPNVLGNFRHLASRIRDIASFVVY